MYIFLATTKTWTMISEFSDKVPSNKFENPLVLRADLWDAMFERWKVKVVLVDLTLHSK